MSSATTDFLTSARAYRPGVAGARQRGLAAVLGALLGDALGVPHEFKAAHTLPAAPDLVLRMPPTYPKTYSSIPYGTWSDDGSQVLCLLDSLQRTKGTFDAALLGENLLGWLTTARHQAGGLVFDCGGQTRAALQHLQAGTPQEHDHRSLGNGALMRVLPVAVAGDFWGVTAENVVGMAMAQSTVTHPQPLSEVACGLYGALALRVMAEPLLHDDWRRQVTLASYALRRHSNMTTERHQALDELLHFGGHELPTGTGFVANTFWSAIASLERSHDYLGAVRHAILMGNDTDTTACVTGGLAALAWGLDSVPADWWGELRFPDESHTLLTLAGR